MIVQSLKELRLREPRTLSLLEGLGFVQAEDHGEWQDLGTVTLWPDEPPSPTIKVECAQAPVEFWRFTIRRPVESEPGKWESFEVKTGSGRFEEYWPGARAVAENCFSVRALD